MNIPGMPAQYAAKMKQRWPSIATKPSSHCIKPEDVKKPKEDFFGADKSCRYDHFTMGGGKIDIQMVCNAGRHDADHEHQRQLHADQLFDGHVDASGTGGAAERHDA